MSDWAHDFPSHGDVNVVNRLSPGRLAIENFSSRSLPEISDFPKLKSLCDAPREIPIAIIGGGMLGCTIACQLRRDPVFRDKFILIDDNAHFVERFASIVRRIDQRLMRSPFEHQIAPDGAIQLIDFARLNWARLNHIERTQLKRAESGQRAIVPTDLFLGHVRHTISVHDLESVSFTASARRLLRPGLRNQNWVLMTDRGDIRAKHVILATGSKPRSQTWQTSQRKGPKALAHECAYRQITGSTITPKRVAVVGDGMTAAHLALHFSGRGIMTHWILKGEERFALFDTPSSFLRTEGLAYFQRHTVHDRARLLHSARPASIIPEMKRPLIARTLNGILTIHRNNPVVELKREKEVIGLLLADRTRVIVDQAVCATGQYPKSELLKSLDVEFESRWPLVNDQTLEPSGTKNLHVIGALASLSLGPAAANIDGARLATETLLRTLHRSISRSNPSSRHSKRIVTGTCAVVGCPS